MDFGDLPAWIALIISIWTAHHQNQVNARSEETRKATEATAKKDRESDHKKRRIDQLYRDVEDLSALAIDYWTRPGSSAGASGILINSKMKDLSSRIGRYGLFLWPSASQDFLTFKQAVTGGAFQSLAREAAKPQSAEIRNISNASSSLKDKLRTQLDTLDLPDRF